MGEAAGLQYHADTLRLLGVTPRVDPDAVGRITQAETACGRRLPAALREWYVLAGAEELLTLDEQPSSLRWMLPTMRCFQTAATRLPEQHGIRRHCW